MTMPTLSEELLSLEPLIRRMRELKDRVDVEYAVLRNLGGELWAAGGTVAVDPKTANNGAVYWMKFSSYGVPDRKNSTARDPSYVKGHEFAKEWDGSSPSVGVLKDDEVTDAMKAHPELGERIFAAMKAWTNASEAFGVAQKKVQDASAKVLQ